MGSILGPILFDFFVNDFILFIKQANLHNYADNNTITQSAETFEVFKKLIKTWKEEKWKRRMCTYHKNHYSCEKNNPKIEVSITIKYIYFDGTNIIGCWSWKVFLGIGVPGKWVRSLNTCEGVSFLIKLLAEARRLWSIWSPRQAFLKDFAKFQSYFISNFGF